MAKGDRSMSISDNSHLWDSLSGMKDRSPDAEAVGETETRRSGLRNREMPGRPIGQAKEGRQFPVIDQILADPSVSVSEAVSQFLQIVSRADVSLAEREEALAHGLNLDFSQFVALVEDPHLPQPLARRFFDEMRNFNQRRDLQIRACISLVDHEDPALRQEAAEQLGFYIGLEEWVQQPEVLKQEARSFLEEWSSRPVQEPVAMDTDGDIPSTEAIPLHESDQESVFLPEQAE